MFNNYFEITMLILSFINRRYFKLEGTFMSSFNLDVVHKLAATTIHSQHCCSVNNPDFRLHKCPKHPPLPKRCPSHHHLRPSHQRWKSKENPLPNWSNLRQKKRKKLLPRNPRPQKENQPKILWANSSVQR